MKNYRAAEGILTLKTPPKTKQNTNAWGILLVLCFCFCFEEKKNTQEILIQLEKLNKPWGFK